MPKNKKVSAKIARATYVSTDSKFDWKEIAPNGCNNRESAEEISFKNGGNRRMKSNHRRSYRKTI